ncbi:GTP-binding protein [Candidatus Gracilibacteria bacterium]|nr:MAG: GTP-binding protein [Candidatus Gracilibacteria bacterium]
MQYDVHPFLSGHPELQDRIFELKKSNPHFAKLLREYEGIALEIGRAESNVPGYNMEDLALDQLKKERLAIKDELISFLK